jgi:hypothetical protein
MAKHLMALASLMLASCTSMSGGGSQDLLAHGLDGFVETGGGDWSFADGVASAKSGTAIGYLATKEDFLNFEFQAEVFVGDPHNSGVFIRCADRNAVGATTCYEANIYDKRPDQAGRTGAVPGYFTPPLAKVDAANRWNTIRIRAQGPHITIVFNGVTTVDADGPLNNAGAIALQWGEGDVRFRNVRVKRL